MHGRTSLPVLLWLLAFCAPGMRGQAAAQCDNSSLTVHVDSVVAGEAASGIDPRIGPGMRGRLHTLFDYHSYRLLRTDEADTPCGQAVAFNLPGGRILHVAPLAIHGNLIALELVLFAGSRAVMKTELKVFRGGVLVLVGPQSPHQAYITSIRIESGGPEPATAAKPIPTSTSGPISTSTGGRNARVGQP